MKIVKIIEYIPHGRDNAITRAELVRLTGLSDRNVRAQISQARRNNVIINLQDGGGYYRPTERAEIERYAMQEEHRLKSIGWSLKAARDALREV